MKISICTSIYQGARFISEIWYNLINQTYQNFVWVVVDDGSYDESYYIVKELQRKYPSKIRLYKARYRKEGYTYKFEYADDDSDILMILDVDDLLHNKSLELIVDFLKENPHVDWLYTQSNTFFPESNNLHSNEETSYAGNYISIHENGFLDYNLGNIEYKLEDGTKATGVVNPTIGHVRAVRKKLWSDNNIRSSFPIIIGDDMDMGYWLECYGNYHIILRPLHYYRYGEHTTTRNQKMREKDINNQLKQDDIVNRHLEFRKQNNIVVKQPLNPPTKEQHLLGLSLCFGSLQFESESQKIGLSTNYNHSLDDVNYVMKYWREHNYHTDLSECDYIFRSIYIDGHFDINNEINFINKWLNEYNYINKKITICAHANMEEFPNHTFLSKLMEKLHPSFKDCVFWTFNAKFRFYYITINQKINLPENIRKPVLHNSLLLKKFLRNEQDVYHIQFVKGLGDTLAWMPYVEEFRKKNRCKVYVTTKWNFLFDKTYTDIKFIDNDEKLKQPFTTINLAMNHDESDLDSRNIPLQQTASERLNLKYKEIKPNIIIPDSKRNIQGKYVTLSCQSTAQSKYWNYKNGWKEIVDYLLERDYKVVCIDKYDSFGDVKTNTWNIIPNGVINKTGDIPLEDRIIDLKYAKFHIGISTGLSWLAWAIGTPVVLVSSCGKPFNEFQSNCIRVYQESEKSGYCNDIRYQFNDGDWHWNPIMECKSKEDWYKMEVIEPFMVKKAIDKMINFQFYNIEEQRYWNDSEWDRDGEEWSDSFGGTDTLWKKYIYGDIKEYLSGNVLEIACGHGRMTEKLLQNEIEYTGIDLNQNCVDRCKERFVDYSNVNFIVNDGISLNMVGDKSIDLVFSWDSFVHMHKNIVESYFSEISRVLKDDGKILIHHANFSGGSDLSFENWHGRANLTHQEFLTICKKYSIKIINQRPIVMKAENSSVTDMISLCGK